MRYYQRIGLLSKPARPASSLEFGASELACLRFVRRAKSLGFALKEIASLLDLLSTSDCLSVERIARDRLAAVVEKIADLHRVESVLTKVMRSCGRRAPYQRCPIIETLVRD